MSPLLYHYHWMSYLLQFFTHNISKVCLINTTEQPQLIFILSSNAQNEYFAILLLFLTHIPHFSDFNHLSTLIWNYSCYKWTWIICYFFLAHTYFIFYSQNLLSLNQLLFHITWLEIMLISKTDIFNKFKTISHYNDIF